jgi:hypothetical protein
LRLRPRAETADQRMLVKPLNPTLASHAPSAWGYRTRFSKTSFATGIAENTLGHPT